MFDRVPNIPLNNIWSIPRFMHYSEFSYIWFVLPLIIPANFYLFKVNNRNTRKACVI